MIRVGLLPILLCAIAEANVLVADNAMTRMVELTAGAPFCSLYTDRGIIQRMVLGADPKRVRQISTNLVADLEKTCKASRERAKSQNGTKGLIYPGTKWCGPGNQASSFEDLGQHRAEDSCCREHDQCQVTLAPKQCIHGICNNSPFTRSHCDCDSKFRRCLQNVNTEVANTLGALFFNVIQVTCFKERRPCSKWQNCTFMWVSAPKYVPRRNGLRGLQSIWLKPIVRTVSDYWTVRIHGRRKSPTYWDNHLFLNGYSEEMSTRLCSQYKFRPSDKYVPLMPPNINL